MNRLYVSLSAILLASAAPVVLPAAAAQCSGDLVPPHVAHLGKHASPTTGNGTVRVQVQVNPDGSYHVTRVVSSTNHGDDAAAREVASSSSYRPATCSGRPVVWLYDPLFHFSGASVSSSYGSSVAAAGASGGGSSLARVNGLIMSGQYDTAKSLAQSALANHPNDAAMLQLLGVAEYYSHDYDDAAAAFARAGTPGHQYQIVAAQAYANAAVHLSETDTQQALDYAQRAVAIDHSANSRYALGVAQLGAKQYSAAAETLRSVHAAVFADPHAEAQQRYALDQRILQAYVGMNDLASAQPIVDEMRKMQPSNPFPTQEIGMTYLTQGDAAKAASNDEQAIALYGKAAALGDPRVSVAAYDRSANVVASETHPDSATVKGYADKALAIDPNDTVANFFEGYAYVLQYGASHSADAKKEALTYLGKADSLAKTRGPQSLAQQAEHLMSELNGTGLTP